MDTEKRMLLTELQKLRAEKQGWETERAELTGRVICLEKQVTKLQEENQCLQHNYDTILHALDMAKKSRFGAQTETGITDISQLNLFSRELDTFLEGEMPEPKKVTVKGHTRPVRKSGDQKELISELPVKMAEHPLDEEKRFCSECGAELVVIGKKAVRSEVVFHPAYLEVIVHTQLSYKCPECLGGGNPDSQEIIQSEAPVPLLQRSVVSAGLAAWIIYQKYDLAVPYYRQEKDWARMNFPVKRLRMAYWVIRISEIYLEPLFGRMKIYLMQRDIIMSDETTWQCNMEPGKKASSKCDIWVHRSCPGDREPAIILYQYTRTRAGEHAKLFLENFQGYSVTDAYVGYEQVEGITRCLCFSHLRRYYIEAAPLGKDKKPLPGCAAMKGIGYCDKLFALEKKWKELSPEERKEKRQTYSAPVLEAFFAWAESVKTDQEALKKALGYTLRHREYFSSFLLDGRIPLSNNSSEGSIKVVAVSRKNSLFSDSIKGAEAAAQCFSFISTARANGLDTYKYLEYILTELPGKDLQDPQILDRYLPWSEQVQEHCRCTVKYKNVEIRELAGEEPAYETTA